MASRAVARPRKRKRTKMTVPLTVAFALMSGLQEPLWYVKEGRVRDGIAQASKNYVGYDPIKRTFYFGNLKEGIYPLLFGVGVHKLANRIGINRIIAQAGIPWIRI